jgi:hypothetical protein
MEKSPVMIALLTMMMVKSVNAQIGSKGTDSKQKTQSGATIGADKLQKEDRIEMKIDDVPEELKNTLQTDNKYKDLKISRIYLDRTNSHYVVHFTDSIATRTLHFDETGVLIDSLDRYR